MAKINDIDVSAMLVNNLTDVLVKSSTQRTQRQLNCPYCHKGKPIVDDNIAFVGVESDAGQLWFNSDKFVGHDEAEFVNIAYCPMCGRRLDDKNL